MPLPGGPTTVAGIRYEYRWTALRLLDVLAGEAASIRIEIPGEDGFEFALTRPEGAREYHQVKRQAAAGHWTLAALDAAGVLVSFIKKLADEPNAKCLFFSGVDAHELRELSERAHASAGQDEFQAKFLTSDPLRKGFARVEALSSSDAAAYEYLKRIEVRTGDERLLVELAIARCRHLVGHGDPRNVADALFQLAMDSTHRELDAKALSEFLQQRGFSLGTSSNAPAWRRPRPWNIPQRPTEYQPRDELNALKLSLIGGGTQAMAITSQHRRLGIQGMPGAGKTVLATGLVTDPDVQDAFPGGLFWLTLGQFPDDALVWQGKLAAALAGRPVDIRTLQEGKTTLGELFAARPPTLLILDDVWDVKHASPFDVPEAPSRLLITTRNRDVANGLDATVCDLRELTPADALAMFAAYVGRAAEALPEMAKQIVKECGELPLAVAMAGAMLRGRPEEQWPTLVDRLQKADLAYLEARLPQYRKYQSVLVAIDVSVGDLPNDLQLRYRDFAVFPEDVPVPERVLQRLWATDGLELAHAQKSVNVLVDRSLVRRDAQGRLALHDLQHDYARAKAGNLAQRHARLVEAYRSTSPDKALHTVAGDGYFFEHIAKHVRNGEGAAALRALFFDHRWLMAKLNATGVNALLADFELLDLGLDKPLRILRDAIRLSAHVLSKRPGEFSSQVLGRLHDAPEPELQHLCARVGSDATPPALLPVWPTLQPPGALRRTLDGHVRHVVAMALSKDGKTAVSGSYDRTLKVWDVETGQLRRTLEGHADEVRAVALSEDGETATSGSSDGTLKVWNVGTGQLRRTLEGHTGVVSAVVLSEGGKRAVSGSYDKTLKVWDVETGQVLRTLKGHTDRVHAAALSEDGKTVVSGSADKTLKVWDVETGQLRGTLEGHAGRVNAVVLSADGKTAVSGSADRTLKVWEVEAGQARQTLKSHTGRVNAVALSADGKTAVSGSADRTLKMWEVETGLVRRTLEGHSSGVNAVALSADGKTAVSVSADRTVKVWEVETGQVHRALEGHAGRVNAVALSADGKTAVSGSDDRTVKAWDVELGHVRRTLEGHAGRVNAVALSADGKTAVSGSADRTLKMWEVETGQVCRTLEGHSSGVNAVALSEGGKTAVSGSDDGTVKVWDLELGQVRRTLEGHAHVVNAVALSKDGKTAVSSSYDKTLKVWDVETGQARGMLGSHAKGVSAVALSEDVKTLISGSTDGKLQVWDVETGRVRRTLGGHAGRVNAVALNEDGSTFVSGSIDGTLKVWNVKTGECLASFTGDADFRAVAISRTMHISAGDKAGRVHLLELRLTAKPQRPFASFVKRLLSVFRCWS